MKKFQFEDTGPSNAWKSKVGPLKAGGALMFQTSEQTTWHGVLMLVGCMLFSSGDKWRDTSEFVEVY